MTQVQMSSRTGYEKSRRTLLIAGALVLLALAAYQWVTARNPLEVAGTFLFVPVFLAFVYWGTVGGLVAGVLAATAYVALYYETISAVGFGQIAPQLGGRMLSYVLFGVLGGWASQRMRASLDKLQIHDQICDSTGLFNARFFVMDADLEMARAKRYQSTFSAALFDIPVGALSSFSRRRLCVLLKGLGDQVKESVRLVDRPVYAYSGTLHRFAVLLPETSREGAEVFVNRTREKLVTWLKEQGAKFDPSQIQGVAMTYPEDDSMLSKLRDEFAEVERVEFSLPKGALTR